MTIIKNLLDHFLSALAKHRITLTKVKIINLFYFIQLTLILGFTKKSPLLINTINEEAHSPITR